MESMAQLLDGKIASQKILDMVREGIVTSTQFNFRKPGLAVIVVGDNPASQVYVGHKLRACESVGIFSKEYRLPASASMEEVKLAIDELNRSPNIDGILVQMPLPAHLDAIDLVTRIDPSKDVDGFTPHNLTRLLQGRTGLFPCTPLGVMRLLEMNNIAVRGKHAVILGRSLIVGRPLLAMLLDANATVTVTHSHTEHLKEICQTADILFAAIGRPGFVEGSWIKPGAVVVDVGINRVTNPSEVPYLKASEPERYSQLVNKGSLLVGDVRFGEAEKIASFITPVPGGVGPLTIAMLLKNTLRAAKKEVHD